MVYIILRCFVMTFLVNVMIFIQLYIAGTVMRIKVKTIFIC